MIASVPPPEPPARKASLRHLLSAVFWSFFGVRKGTAMQQDAVTIKPHQVIIVGVIAAAVIVVTLLLLVRLIVHSAGQG